MNRSQQKGTAFETSLLEALRRMWPEAHRLGKQGTKDLGDFWLPPEVPFIIEAKNEAHYAGKLSGWISEAMREMENAGKLSYLVIHKRSGTTDPFRQYVTTTVGAQLSIVRHYAGAQ